MIHLRGQVQALSSAVAFLSNYVDVLRGLSLAARNVNVAVEVDPIGVGNASEYRCPGDSDLSIIQSSMTS